MLHDRRLHFTSRWLRKPGEPHDNVPFKGPGESLLEPDPREVPPYQVALIPCLSANKTDEFPRKCDLFETFKRKVIVIAHLFRLRRLTNQTSRQMIPRHKPSSHRLTADRITSGKNGFRQLRQLDSETCLVRCVDSRALRALIETKAHCNTICAVCRFVRACVCVLSVRPARQSPLVSSPAF